GHLGCSRSQGVETYGHQIPCLGVRKRLRCPGEGFCAWRLCRLEGFRQGEEASGCDPEAVENKVWSRICEANHRPPQAVRVDELAVLCKRPDEGLRVAHDVKEALLNELLPFQLHRQRIWRWHARHPP